jgi:uncharacterized membrane protein YciS (DUF1049 family)
MWITAIFGMTTKYVEVTLGHKYRTTLSDGSISGGPMYYIEKGLNINLAGKKLPSKWIAILFAFLMMITAIGSGNMPQINNIALVMNTEFAVPKLFTGLFLGGLLWIIIIGGIKRIASVASKIIPIMGLIYFGGALIILIENYQNFDIVDENYDLEMSEILNKSPDIIYNYAVQNKNEIRVAETNVEIAKKSLELNKSFLQPRLSAFYSFSSRIAYSDRLVGTGNFDLVPIGFVQGTNQPVVAPFQQTIVKAPRSFTEQFDSNKGQNFGLSLSIPILNNFSTRTNVNRSKVNVERSENLLSQTKLDLQNTINQAYNDAKGSFKAYEASQKSLESRKISFEYAKEKFNLGAIDSYEFSLIKQRYESAQSDLIISKFDLIFKIKVLEFYFGIPLKI